MANTTFQLKRSSVAGKQPNTSTLSTGELAINITDQKIYSSNGTGIFEPAANVSDQRITSSLTIDNDKRLRFKTVNTSAYAAFVQQSDDNFVFYTTNTSYGTRAVFSIYANSDTSELSFVVPARFNANININGIIANGSLGTSGQVLSSNGTATYWTSVGGTGTVTSVGSGNGLTGGPITTSGTLSVLANNGIVSNSSGVFVNGNSGITSNSSGVFVTQGTGTVVNATGVHVNSTYIGTLSANNASYLGGISAASYVNTSGNYTLSGNISVSGLLTATGGSKISVMENQDGGNSRGIFLWNENDTNWGIYMSQSGVNKSLANGTAAAGLNGSSTYAVRFRAANATPTDQAGFIWENHTEVALMQLEPSNGDLFLKRNINAASFNVGTSTISNSTGVYTGTVNAASHTVGTSFTANSTVVNAVSYYAGTLLVANTTVVNATHLGGTAAASYQLNSTLNANIASYLPTYTGVVNASSFNAGATGTGTGGSVQNTTVFFVGNNTINAAVNTTTLYIGGNVIANSTGANNAFNLGGTAAASYQLNSTLGANIAAYLPTYTGTVNAASFNAGATGTGTGGSVQNTTTMFVGNNTINTSISAGSITVNGTAVIANNTGVYTTGVVNAASHTTGATGTGTGGVIANTTIIFIGNNTINAAVNTTTLYIGGNVIANSTGANNAFNLGGTAAASYQLNSTLNANIASYLPVYTGTVNGAIHQTGAGYGSATGGATVNTTNISVGNSTSNINLSYGALTVNGTAVIANNSGVFATGTVNAASHTTGAIGTGTGGIVANTTVIFIGNNTINAAVNTTTLYIGGNVIANSTGANNAFNLGGTAAASYQLNSTLAANVATLTSNNASYLGGVAAASYFRSDTGDTFSGGVAEFRNDAGILGSNTGQVNGLQVYQSTAGADALMTFHVAGDFAGHFGIDGTTNDLFVGGWSYGANKYKIWHQNNDGAGSTLDADLLDGQQGSYYTNATNITTGTLPYAQIPANVINTTAAFTRSGITTFSANVVLGSSGVSANGSFGTAGQLLTTNGTATYWSTVSSGASANSTGGTGAVQYYNGTTFGSSANIIFSGTQLTVGNSTANSSLNQNQLYGTLGMGNANTFNLGSYTTSASINQMIVGPFTVASGNTITVASGSRLVIV
jgi:hypothetical protein